MILVGIGANLPAPGLSSPRETCDAAVSSMEGAGLTIARQSRWYRSSPVPISDQPWFINGVVDIETALKPLELLDELNRIEERFGRTRGQRNAPRTLDLDLLAYGDTVLGWGEEGEAALRLPHPRMHERAFVLLPLRDIAPDWRHPVLSRSLDELVEALDPLQQTLPDGEDQQRG